MGVNSPHSLRRAAGRANRSAHVKTNAHGPQDGQGYCSGQGRNADCLKRLENDGLKDDLIARFDQFISPGGDLAILPFDEDAALICGQHRALRERQGRYAPPSDMMIAAIAGALGAGQSHYACAIFEASR
jgi:hypothetical protein